MYSMIALALLATPTAPQERQRERKLDPFIAKAVEPDPRDSPLRKLQKERCRERAAAIVKIQEVIDIGRWDPSYYSEYVKLQTTLFENLAELMTQPADRVKCYELRLAAAKEFEGFIKIRFEAGLDPPQNLHIAKAYRLDAEIDLLKVKAEAEKGGKK